MTSRASTLHTLWQRDFREAPKRNTQEKTQTIQESEGKMCGKKMTKERCPRCYGSRCWWLTEVAPGVMREGPSGAEYWESLTKYKRHWHKPEPLCPHPLDAQRQAPLWHQPISPLGAHVGRAPDMMPSIIPTFRGPGAERKVCLQNIVIPTIF